MNRGLASKNKPGHGRRRRGYTGGHETGNEGEEKEEGAMAARFRQLAPAVRRTKKPKPGTDTTKGTTTESGLFKRRRCRA